MMIGASELPNRDVKILRFLSDGSNCFYLLGSLYACKIHELQHFNPSNRIGSDGNMTGKTHGVILISPWFPRCSGLVHWRHSWIQSPSNSNRHVGSLPATSLPRETYGPKKIGLFPFSGFNHFDPHKKIAQMDSQRVCISGSIPFLLLKKCQYLKCFLWAISEIIQNGGSVGSNPSQPSGSLEIVSGTSSRCWGSFLSLSRLRSWTQSMAVAGCCWYLLWCNHLWIPMEVIQHPEILHFNHPKWLMIEYVT